ncbi:MAG: hypothetical protein OEY20_02775 [Gemmatimonadota bacterium]|nr:hypothetical protein [Gemmatimonadota bacterium]MDH4349997.1 hypothetical protein [Gemmatimonadota bacterium]MDH5196160.1 hypothetical protein [Gemmatimonadota bacterium]
MKVDFAVACDYAIVDQHGKLSVLGIFQHIWAGRFPTVHPRLHLVVRLRGRRTEVGEHRLRIRLLDEADNEILTGDGTVVFNEPPAGVTEVEAGAVLNFDVPFEQPGRYHFEIAVDGTVEATVPIGVSQSPQSPQVPPAHQSPLH